MRLASEEPAAGLDATRGRTVVFNSRRISLDENLTLRAEDLGIPGGVLDAMYLDEERLLVVGASCGECESAKPVWMLVDRSGKVASGGAGDAFLKSAARARVAKVSGESAGVVFDDISGAVRFAMWSRAKGWGDFVVVDTGARTASLAIDPATGEPLIAGLWNGQIAVWSRGADGVFARAVLGRPARSGADYPPIALAPPGRPLAVVAPSAEVLGSDALYLYTKKESGWTASKIAFTSQALAYDVTVGDDGAPWLAIREATNAALFDLRDLNASPRVVSEAGGSGPIALTVDEAGQAVIALWTQGRTVLIAREAGN
ncbi:MAG: hypothetical protein IT350_08160 [Deltaproteobacteria bacterium]|nr:hypothetical protein [Deltaproteobacteria bacterium]